MLVASGGGLYGRTAYLSNAFRKKNDKSDIFLEMARHSPSGNPENAQKSAVYALQTHALYKESSFYP
tara:strand:+ start:537 stop:737 length:201 start_codon:yes stop_codon:yes gene_type:complete